MFKGHLYIFFCESSVYVFCQFFYQVLVCSVSHFLNFLYVRKITPLFVLSLTNIFPQFVICPLTLLMVFLSVQYIYIFDIIKFINLLCI